MLGGGRQLGGAGDREGFGGDKWCDEEVGDCGGVGTGGSRRSAFAIRLKHESLSFSFAEGIACFFVGNSYPFPYGAESHSLVSGQLQFICYSPWTFTKA
ncbi:hypothetical protein Tco_1068655 [Tanacetum coccineum]|uniref:Uncharacterized protein n=1 Tax=Tanacetum coccineum TaxID=301880 RepID=A0ABQ5HGA5_9ASTR